MTRAERIEAALCEVLDLLVRMGDDDPRLARRHGCGSMVAKAEATLALPPDAPVPADPAPTAPEPPADTDWIVTLAWDLAEFVSLNLPAEFPREEAARRFMARIRKHMESRPKPTPHECGPLTCDCEKDPAPLQSQEPQSLESVRAKLYAIVSSMGQTKAWTIPELFTVLRDRLEANNTRIAWLTEKLKEKGSK